MYTIFGHVTRSQSIIIQLGFASNPKLLVGPCLEAQRTTKHQHDGNENGDGEYETLVTTTADTTTTTRTTTTFVGDASLNFTQAKYTFCTFWGLELGLYVLNLLQICLT